MKKTLILLTLMAALLFSGCQSEQGFLEDVTRHNMSFSKASLAFSEELEHQISSGQNDTNRLIEIVDDQLTIYRALDGTLPHYKSRELKKQLQSLYIKEVVLNQDVIIAMNNNRDITELIEQLRQVVKHRTEIALQLYESN